MKTLNQYITEKFRFGKNDANLGIEILSKKQLVEEIKNRYSKNPKILDIHDFHLSDKITDLSRIFQNLEVETINISSWELTNVKRIDYMFYQCKKLKNIIGLENLVTSATESMRGLFYGCTLLNDNMVEVMNDNWDVSNVESFDQIFNKCTNLVNVDISNWKSNVLYSINAMFANCIRLRSVIFSKDIKMDSARNMTKSNYFLTDVFNGCKRLEEITNFEKLNLKDNFVWLENNFGGFDVRTVEGGKTIGINDPWCKFFNDMFKDCKNLNFSANWLSKTGFSKQEKEYINMIMQGADDYRTNDKFNANIKIS